MALRLSVWLAALWWASLTSVIFGVVPMLFAYLPTPAMAGAMAARIFTLQTWVSSVCALILLMGERSVRAKTGAEVAPAANVYIVTGMLLALFVELAVAPRILANDNLRLWHSVGSVMYLLQWACAAATLWKLTSPRQII